jgi:hypothetical protein
MLATTLDWLLPDWHLRCCVGIWYYRAPKEVGKNGLKAESPCPLGARDIGMTDVE